LKDVQQLEVIRALKISQTMVLLPAEHNTVSVYALFRLSPEIIW